VLGGVSRRILIVKTEQEKSGSLGGSVREHGDGGGGGELAD